MARSNRSTTRPGNSTTSRRSDSSRIDCTHKPTSQSSRRSPTPTPYPTRFYRSVPLRLPIAQLPLAFGEPVAERVAFAAGAVAFEEAVGDGAVEPAGEGAGV